MQIYTLNNRQFVMTEIENTLDAMQEFVDGPIEVINITDEILLVCNEEGKMRGLPPSAFIIRNQEAQDIIVGKFFLCREDGEDMVGIQESDIEDFKRIVLPIM